MPKKKQRERSRRGSGAPYPIRRNGAIVRYAAAVPLGTIEGKRRRKVVYGPTAAEAEAEATKLRADLLRGIDIAPERMTLEQYLNAWLKSVELTKSAGTLRIHRSNSKHIIRLGMVQIRPDQLDSLTLRVAQNRPGAYGRCAISTTAPGRNRWFVRILARPNSGRNG